MLRKIYDVSHGLCHGVYFILITVEHHGILAWVTGTLAIYTFFDTKKEAVCEFKNRKPPE